MKSSTIAALVAQAALTAAAGVEEWKSRSIYFALTDRLSQGSDDSGSSACGNLGDYCGGTFQGLESKLDYIQGMGFNAIWITPVVENKQGGYHGYWAQDLYSINSNYGTADDLKSLVSAAHDKDIFVMIDVVANHMGSGDVGSNKPEPLNQQSSYHDSCEIDYNDQNSVEQCTIAGLPDVKTEDSQIRTLYQDWIRWLVGEYQFDGVRIDTAKHVEKDFWSGFSEAAGVYTIGEVWDGNPSYLAGYTDVMDAVLNYGVYYPVQRFYQQSGSSQAIVDMHDQIDELFSNPAALGTFIDNHDNPRWLSANNDYTLLINALAYVILARGVPIVYYGTEQGYKGGNDPENREDLWRSGFDTNSVLYQSIASLSAARNSLGGLPDDDHTHLYITDNAYAWSRAGGDLVVLTTNGGSGSSGEHCFDSGVTGGSWNDVYNNGTYTADGSGSLCIQVNNGQPHVLVASN